MTTTEARIRASFGRQAMMATIGAEIVHVAPGEVDIALPFAAHLTQQHGFLHGGATGMIADSACGYAALILMPEDAAVMTAEYKMNLLAPAAGARFLAQGRVLRPGRTLCVVEGKVFAESPEGGRKLIAACLATMAVVRQAGLRD